MTHNPRFRQFVILDSRGITSWSYESVYNTGTVLRTAQWLTNFQISGSARQLSKCQSVNLAFIIFGSCWNLAPLDPYTGNPCLSPCPDCLRPCTQLRSPSVGKRKWVRGHEWLGPYKNLANFWVALSLSFKVRPHVHNRSYENDYNFKVN